MKMEAMQLGKEINLEELLEEMNVSICPKSGLPIYKNCSEPYLSSVINYSGTGIFIMDLDLEMIVWGNSHFLELNGLKKEHLFHPAYNELINRNIHPDDLKSLHLAHEEHKAGSNKKVLSKIIRIRQKNAGYKYFYFFFIAHKPQSCPDEQILIGIQFDLMPMLDQYSEMTAHLEEPDYKKEEDFQKLSSLSKREKQILKLIVKGHTDKEIAKQLNISNYTSETHRKNIIQKLQVKNTASLSFLAGKYGIF